MFETVEIELEGESYEVASDANGEIYDVSAEYDDALAVVRETTLPIARLPGVRNRRYWTIRA